MLIIDRNGTVEPLDTITISTDTEGTIAVWDAEGREYYREPTTTASVTVSGSLGSHLVLLLDVDGRILEKTSFSVDTATDIDDDTGKFRKLCSILRHTHHLGGARDHHVLFADGDVYHMHSVASRDNVHAMKGAMYFMRHMKEGLDLHAKYQHENGMIWDFAGPANPHQSHHHDWRWSEDRHRRSNDRAVSFGRQPEENDVEHQHIRGIWRAWKCTGDDDWMKGKLDSALKAMRWSRTDEWSWSKKYGLLKRPFTIDTWDFTSKYDKWQNHWTRDGVTEDLSGVVCGVMHGDNTGMADACDKLAEMLRFAGRDEEAKEAQGFADSLRERLDQLAWNGEFFTHHVSEDPSYERDFGVDESTQVSLSNAYALTRGITHEQAVAIIRTYQRIRTEMPQDAPAEFFMIYPPFRKGWGPAASPGQYTNGAVTGILAGELARGAFEHGFEDYGADILQRWITIMEDFDNSMPWALRGEMPKPPERSFDTLDLRGLANADLMCEDDGVLGWNEDPGMDMRELPRGKQVMKDVPFDIIEGNERKSLLRLARHREGFTDRVTLKLNRKFGSLYFLHSGAGSPVTGEVTFKYADGTEKTRYVVQGRDVLPDWAPPELPGRDRGIVRKDFFTTVTAWRGKCPRFWDIGLAAHGMDNPKPEKTVDSIQLRAGATGHWMIIAMTLSDAHAFFMPGKEGHGVPQPWAAGALSAALFEGLAGVVDTDRNMQTVRLSPRWASAGVDKVTACVKYEEGGGYVRYIYERQPDRLILQLSGNSSDCDLQLLLPDKRLPGTVTINDQPAAFTTRQVEGSTYLCVPLPGIHAKTIVLHQPSKA